MALVVNTNVSSLNAQRNLTKNSGSLGTAMERLSSGLRINKAADDAAGLAIANGLTAQSRGLSQAIRNAGDGLSLLGTAEAAVSEQTNLLQRIRELSIQSASDTNSSSNREALNEETTALINEFERIANTVEFNGTKLLDGTFSAKQIQIGSQATANDRLSIDLSSTRSTAVGAAYTQASASAIAANAATSGQVKITVGGTATDIGATASDGVSFAQADSSALAYANAINAKSGVTGVTAEAVTTFTSTTKQDNTAADLDSATNFLKINNIDVGAVGLTSDTDESLVNAINAKANQTGVTASLVGDKIKLNADDGRNVTVAVGGSGATLSGLSAGTTQGSLTMRSANDFQVTDGTTANSLLGAASADASQSTTENVSAIDISSKSGAQLAVKIVDVALQNLNTKRAQIGAQTNRLNSVVSNLSTINENVESSKSRILDADFASETATMTRTQILQQASISVLSQANQLPQQALSLLR